MIPRCPKGQPKGLAFRVGGQKYGVSARQVVPATGQQARGCLPGLSDRHGPGCIGENDGQLSAGKWLPVRAFSTSLTSTHGRNQRQQIGGNL